MTGIEYRITISATHVRARRHKPGDAQFVDLEPGEVRTEEHLRTIQVLEQWLKRWQLLTTLEQEQQRVQPGPFLFVPGTFELLGMHLWKLAFDNEVGRDIVASRAMTERDGLDTMRVRISFDKAHELALLPWEFLQYPGDGGSGKFWLSVETKLVLGRFVDGPPDRDIDLADEKVRVIFISHLPVSDKIKAQRQHCAQLVSALREMGKKCLRLEVEPLERWHPEEFQALLEGFDADDSRRVDVVHLVALFRMNERQCEVLLPSPRGGDHWQSPDVLVANICTQPDRGPALVILHLIDGDDGEFVEHAEQVAPEFIRQGIPAVLAMQYPMTAEQAESFLTAFYRALTNGGLIGEAVQEGRRKLRLRGIDRHFGTPVLYMQSKEDGFLIAVDANGGGTTGPVPPSPEKRSTGQRRAKHTRKPDTAQSVRTRLLEALETANGRPSPAYDEVRGWVQRITWPEQDAAARQRLLQQLRRQQDDQEYSRLLNVLLGVLTSAPKVRR